MLKLVAAYQFVLSWMNFRLLLQILRSVWAVIKPEVWCRHEKIVRLCSFESDFS